MIKTEQRATLRETHKASDSKSFPSPAFRVVERSPEDFIIERTVPGGWATMDARGRPRSYCSEEAASVDIKRQGVHWLVLSSADLRTAHVHKVIPLSGLA